MRGAGAAFDALVVGGLRTSGVRSLVAALALALGVGAVHAIDVASASVAAATARERGWVASDAAFDVEGIAGTLDERLLARVRAVPGVRSASPVVGGTFVLAGSTVRAAAGEPVRVIGLDVLQPLPGDADPRAELPGAFAPQGSPPGPEALVGTAGAFASPSLAGRLGLVPGGSFDGFAGGRPVRLRLAGLLPTHQTAFDADALVVDLSVAQRLFAKAGRLDRIACVVDPGSSDGIRDRVARAAAPARIVDPDARAGAVRETLDRYVRDLRRLAWLALLAGALLACDGIGASVVERRADIGTLRALGATRGAVALAFVGEGVLIGAAGSIGGLIAGDAVASMAAAALAAAAHVNLGPDVDRQIFDLAAALRALAGGLIVAVPAAVVPAAAASRLSPVAAFASRGREGPARRLTRTSAVVALLLLAVAGTCLATARRFDVPELADACAAALLASAASSIPLGLTSAGRLLRGVAARGAFPPGFALAGAQLGAWPRRLAFAVAAMALGVAFVAGSTTLAATLQADVGRWAAQTYAGDLSVLAPDAGVPSGDGLPRALVERIARLPGVARVETTRIVSTVVRGALVTLEATNAGAFGLRAGTAWSPVPDAPPGRTGGEPSPGPSPRPRIAALMDGAFARRFGTRVGDAVPLETPAGVVSAVVTGVYDAPGARRGTLVLDDAAYRRLYRDDRVGAVTVFATPGASLQTLRGRLARAAATSGAGVESSRARRAAATTAFDAAFTLVRTLSVLAAAIALGGFGTTLFALVLERRHDLRALRIAGLSRAGVRALVRWQAVAAGSFAVALGTAAGCGVAAALLVGTGEPPGDLRLPWTALGLLGAVAVAGAAGVSSGPAAAAARTRPEGGRQ